MHDNGGIAIAVNQSAEGVAWGAAEHIFDGARDDNLAPPDFREGAETHRSLHFAVESIAKKIALRRLTEGE